MKARFLISTALSVGVAASVLAVPEEARADSTAECNTNNRPDATANTADDGLECGENATASGDKATALGNDTPPSNFNAVAVGEAAVANKSNIHNGFYLPMC